MDAILIENKEKKMKILFMQNTDDAMGGIVNVNVSIMSKFIDDGKEVSLISLRHSGKNMQIAYPQNIKQILINKNDLWGCPRYNQVIEYLKHGKIIFALKHIIARVHYNKGIVSDYLKCKEIIKEENPDIIINSHYELLDAIPEEFLPVTINHFHTSFDQVKENSSYMKIFDRYKYDIAKFVWLSKSTCEKAVEAGLVNSTYIYNPVTFSTKKIADLSQKRVVFIGRFSEEKQIGRAVRLFTEVVEENEIKDWIFDIYGVGELDDIVKEEIDRSKYIYLKGKTSNAAATLQNYSVFMLTSRFEGMALVVLEANECGIPVVCFDFGEAAKEEIIHGKTGFIVNQNDEIEYKNRLLQLIKDEKKRQEMGNNAKQFTQQFNINAISKKWYLLFEEIMH